MKHIKNIRADVVGSMLRPAVLLDMQENVRQKKATLADLTAAEDRAVKEAVRIQEEVGMDIVTDGEMRRPVFCHNFVKAVDGFEWGIPGNTVTWFTMDGTRVTDPVTVGMVRPLTKKHDISVDEFAFLRGMTDRPKKITIPSPTMMTYYFVPGISDRVMKPSAFLGRVTEILHDAVTVLEEQGVEHIQIDAPDFGMLIDPVQREWFAHKGFRPDRLVADGVAMINDVLSGFHGTTSLHICRGNDKNRFMARGGYEAIAPHVFRKARVDRLLLEFDSDRAGGFAPLTHVPEHTTAVLGLVTTKSPVLEEDDDLIRKIREASAFVPMERLAISTQCGFASVARGNNISFDDQRNKLSLVSRIAARVWREI